MEPQSPQYTATSTFAWTLALGALYGFVTELITAVVFKAPLVVQPPTVAV